MIFTTRATYKRIFALGNLHMAAKRANDDETISNLPRFFHLLQFRRYRVWVYNVSVCIRYAQRKEIIKQV